MKVVLDTNIWISAIIWGGIPDEIISLGEQQKITITMSLPLFQEIKNTFSKSKLQPKLKALGLTGEIALNLIQKLVVFYPINNLNVPELRDPDDTIVLATAIASDANIIITGDQDLLTLEEYQNIAIMTASDFLVKYFNYN